MTTFLLDLRNHAMRERNKDAQAQVRRIADEIQSAIIELEKLPTHDNLATLNGLWARAHRYITEGNSGDAPTRGGAGLKEGAQLAQAA